MAFSGSHLSKDFFDLVKAIGESKSKQQEDAIIMDEVATLKKRIGDAGVTKKKMKEFLIRLVYVEMLGHDASFGYIKAIELAASKNLVQKRVGYLCSGLCLSPSHEFRFMLVNQLQQDMASANYLEVAASLSATLRLATSDMIPALVDRVVKLGAHTKELVRKKVAMVLHRFYQLDSSAVSHLGDAMRRTLCDKDPSVMAAALCLLHDMIVATPKNFKELVPSFVSILKQIVEHRLPRDFDYHRIPAPWAQLRLLRIFGALGRADQAASEGMYEVLSDVMRRADAGINVGYAIVYECVFTITTIYPNATLLDEAAKSISRFLASDNNNLKYLGITGLAQVVESHPKYAADHQLAVIECLEDGDETLKRKTLDLLYRMINPVNVEFIASKLLASLESTNDEFLRADLVSRLSVAAERFAPSNEWYVATVIRVMELAGDLLQPEVTQNLVALVAEGAGGGGAAENDDDDAQRGEDDDDDALRGSAVDTFAAMLDWELIPDALLHMLAWILGEYGCLSSAMDLPSMAQALLALCADDARLRGSARSRSLLMTACAKTTARVFERDEIPEATKMELREDAVALASRFATSSDLDLSQRCIEFLGLLEVNATEKDAAVDFFGDVVPYDGSLEDPIEADDPNDSLGFLDRFVASALQAGAAPYAPPQDEDDDDDFDIDGGDNDGDGKGLKFEAYERPSFPSGAPQQQQPTQPLSGAMGGPMTPAQPMGAPQQQQQQQQQQPQQQVPGLTRGAPTRGNAIGGGGTGGGISAAAGPWGAKPVAPPMPPPPPQMPPQQQIVPPPMQQQQQFEQPPPAPPAYEEPPRPKELTEKERMAAALFGGVVDSKKPAARSGPKSGPPPRSRVGGSSLGGAAASRKPAAAHQQQQPQAPVVVEQAPPPPPKAELSLLDFDVEEPVAAAAPQQQPSGTSSSSSPFGAPAGLMMPTTVATPTPPVQKAPAVPDDPFAAIAEAVPEQTKVLAPARLSTADFGGRWTTCRQEKKATAAQPITRTLDAVAKALADAGFHPVEAIPATQELILAATHLQSGGALTLCHAKLLPMNKIHLTLKSSDASVAAATLDIARAAVESPN